MKVVAFAPYALHSPHFETDLELIQTHLDAGDHVEVLVCRRQLPICDMNLTRDRLTCLNCVGRLQTGLSLLQGNFTVGNLLDDGTPSDAGGLPQTLATQAKLKHYARDGFDVGNAVLSTMISITRDPDFDPSSQPLQVAALLQTAWRVYQSLRRSLRRMGDVDRVYIFNGRFSIVRAAVRACQASGVDFFTHEKAGYVDRYILFPNTIPHDQAFHHEQIVKLWENADPQNRREIGSRWFEERAGGVSQNEPTYIAGQSEGKLPDDWDASRLNIAVFLSSEDEFAAVGDEWNNPLYDSQMDGVGRIIASLESEHGGKRHRGIHLYLRVHPNLAGVDNSQTRAIAALQSAVITVIGANDPVSSYTLMNRADKVLTFGSTIGIEAAYGGKPSILAGMTYHRNLGATYNPATHEELVEMLAADLPALDRQQAIQFGYYKKVFGTPFKYYSPTGLYTGTFRGVRVRPSWLKRIGAKASRQGRKVLRLLGRRAKAA